MKNKFPEFNDPYQPDNIPHYNDWPYAPNSDWPHSRHHRWNDSEPANVVPWDWDCCHHDDEDCQCVTSADIDRWNSYSSLSGLTGFKPEDITSALSAINGMSDYSALRDGYYTLSGFSGIWNSAEYIPDIYERLSTMTETLSDKADYSAISAYCAPSGFKTSGTLHIWTDYEKLSADPKYHPVPEPEYRLGTIVGIGTYERPLRLAKESIEAIANVEIATSGNKKLANLDDVEKVSTQLDSVYKDNQSLHHDITSLTQIVEELINGKSAYWTDEHVSLEESKNNPNIFYFWDSKSI